MVTNRQKDRLASLQVNQVTQRIKDGTHAIIRHCLKNRDEALEQGIRMAASPARPPDPISDRILAGLADGSIAPSPVDRAGEPPPD